MATSGCGGDASEGSNGGKPAGVLLSIESSANPEVGDTVKLSASVNDGTALSYAWEVDDASDKVVKSSTSTAAELSFVAKSAGTHTVHCTASLAAGGSVSGKITVPVSAPGAEEHRYLVRIYPSVESGLPPIDRQLTLKGVDLRDQTWTVPDTRKIDVEVSDGTNGLDGHLMLYRSSDDPAPMQVALSAKGLGSFRSYGKLLALVVPTAKAIAPLALDADTQRLSSTWQIELADSGLQVGGKVMSGATPLSGARVRLETRTASGALQVPSTLPTTAADGSYTLRARSGKAVLTIVPPASSGLPVAEVPASAGLQLGSAATGWNFAYQAAGTPVKLAGRVIASDGKTPVSGARVVLTRTLSKVGALSAKGQSYAARGRYQLLLTSDSSGQLTAESGPLELPPGSYTAEVSPRLSESDGWVRETVTVDSSGKLQLELAPRVELSGVVQSADGLSVRARVELVGPRGLQVADSDDNGRFSMKVDRNASYRLRVRPVSSTEHGALLKPELQVKDSDLALGQLQLPKAIAVSARVVTAGGGGIGNALVRVWCRDKKCSSQLVAETRTERNGRLTLRLPR